MTTPSSPAHPVASGLRDAFALTASKLAQAVLALVGFKLLWKTATEADYAEYQAFLFASNALIAVVGWPMWSVLRLGADEWTEGRALGRTFVLHNLLLLASFVLAGALVFARTSSLDLYVNVPGATLLVVAYGFSTAAGNVYTAHLKPAGRVIDFSYVALLGRILWVAALALFAFREWPVDAKTAMVLCLGMTGLPQLALALVLVARLVWPFSLPRRGEASRALQFGVPVLVRQIGVVAFAYLNFAAIKHLLGLEQSARFQVAGQLAEQSALLAVALEDLMGPILARAASRGEAGTLATYYRTIAPQVVLLGSAAFGTALVLARPILAALSAKSVDESAGVLQILLIATAVRLVLTLETPVFDAHLISKPPLFSFLMGFATNVALDVLLVPTRGIEGAAWATLAGWIVNAAIRSGYLGVRFRVRALGLYAMLLPVIVAFAYVRFLGGGSALADALVALALVPSSIFLGKALGILSPETMKALEGVDMPAGLRRLLARVYGASPE
ncbi:hypothetical protein HY251_20165 [bacterium]|nr:hypothetical protein [bacterium]